MAASLLRLLPDDDNSYSEHYLSEYYIPGYFSPNPATLNKEQPRRPESASTRGLSMPKEEGKPPNSLTAWLRS